MAKFTVTDRDGDTIRIITTVTGDALLSAREEEVGEADVLIHKEDAPAFARAVLDLSGWGAMMVADLYTLPARSIVLDKHGNPLMKHEDGHWMAMADPETYDSEKLVWLNAGPYKLLHMGGK